METHSYSTTRPFSVTPMARNVMENIRVQSDDLRDELKELELWEEQMNKLNKMKEQRGKSDGKATGGTNSTLGHEGYFDGAPPIRGTVPSLKAAVQKEVEEKRKAAPLNPVLAAKERGNEYFSLNKIAEAIEAYSEGIECDPNGKSTYILYANRAMCYLRQELWSKAQSDANICVGMNSVYPKGYYRRALAAKHLGNLKDARKDLEAVLALAPNDATAKNELDLVTKMIQMERQKEMEGSAPSRAGKKKIVIQEVDEDEEDEEECAKPEGETTTVNSEDYQLKLQEQQKEVERREREAQEKRLREIEQENVAKAARFKKNDRVEIIEEVEVVQSTETDLRLSPLPEKEKEEEGSSRDCKDNSVSSPHSTIFPDQPSRKLPIAKASKESLTPPKSYSEFERVFSSIENDDELRNHYITLLNPSQIRLLFGSNMSPEILYGVLKSILSLPKPQALEWAKGLSNVNRINDIVLFFSDEEQRVAKEVCRYVEDVAEPKVMQSINRKLMPL